MSYAIGTDSFVTYAKPPTPRFFRYVYPIRQRIKMKPSKARFLAACRDFFKGDKLSTLRGMKLALRADRRVEKANRKWNRERRHMPFNIQYSGANHY